jgi:2-furoyl-CoA dehydrogenase large subunit
LCRPRRSRRAAAQFHPDAGQPAPDRDPQQEREAVLDTNQQPVAPPPWTGQSLKRVEDAALLTGRGRFIDDLPVPVGTLHAAILRSPHAHARILGIDTAAARAAPGVRAVLTGAELRTITASLVVGVKAPVECWPMAIDRVRYVGEPVAMVVARDRYLAEDAMDLLDVRYEPLPAVVDPEAALQPDAPVLHDGFPGNLASDRSFRYGDPEAAFATAAHRIGITAHYPRSTCTPIETYGVVAEYDPAADAYDVLANFQGPFSLHAVLARALRVPGNRLRLRTPPDSGGSFGVKQAVFPYIVLAAAAARIAGRPVKWVEDRLEHLAASVTATNRVTRLEAAVAEDGRILALDWDQIEDCGAHLRAPEPATLYRMHGNMTGAYDIRHMAIRNRVVVTNKVPTGLNRGFGGPQVYFALERLVQRIARRLGLDPVDVVRRNLVQAAAFPYRTASGALLDSGDYAAALAAALDRGDYAELLRRRDTARAEGRHYGIGIAAVVEPSVSNMGYITTVLTAGERRRAGPKNGAQATATVALDPVGAVTVHVASVPQGQGHRTVLAQVVADVFGLRPADIRVVTEMDTARDAWSIASGNYASRFAPAVAGTAHLAAMRLRDKLARIAAAQLNVAPGDVEFVAGRLRARGNPDNALAFGRVAATAHWAPATLPEGAADSLRETVFWTPDELTAPTEADEVNSSLCHGFIFDLCGVEVDRVTAEIRIDRYVTMHDCGRILHPEMVAGQVTGGFAQALGAALLEEHAYAPDGSFLSGTFADYLLPTVMEVPEPLILHHETPSPFTPLGAKGVGEGNCMSTPVCLANAVADALDLEDVTLPLLPARLAEHLRGPETTRPDRQSASTPGGNHTAPPPGDGRAPPSPPKERGLFGEGRTEVAAPVARVWALLLDPDALAALIPGAHGVRKLSDTAFEAEVTLGIGPVKGRYRASVHLSNLDPPRAATLTGQAEGALGFGRGSGRVTLEPVAADRTVIAWRYEAAIGGKVAAVGGRLLDGAARVVIRQFFAALGRSLAGGAGVDPLAPPLVGLGGEADQGKREVRQPDRHRLPLWRRLLAWLGRHP